MNHIELIREFADRVMLFEGDAEFTLRVPQKDAPVPMDIVYRGCATKIVHVPIGPSCDNVARPGVPGDEEHVRWQREFELADPGSVRMTVRITAIESVGAARLTNVP